MAHQKITPFLWFDSNAEEAVNFYTAVFTDSSVQSLVRMPDGKVLTIGFQLNGQSFAAINGGPMFTFNEAVSFVINCENQAEIDYYWQKLTENGGQESQCGWLKDKFGVSWQVVPTNIGTLLSGNNDGAKAQRAMQALMQMRKLNIAALENA